MEAESVRGDSVGVLFREFGVDADAIHPNYVSTASFFSEAETRLLVYRQKSASTGNGLG